MDAAKILDDPAFQRLLTKRSKIRWGFSATLIGAYLGYGMAGLWIPEIFATAIPGSSVPLGMAMGFGLIGASVAMSMIYVRIINRLEIDNAYLAERS